MESIWEKNAKRGRLEALSDNKSTDVLIVGGGLAGILCALRLREAGTDCILVEAGEIGSGITKNTTAKISLAHGLLYDKTIRRFGVQKARLYVEAQRKASTEYARLCQSTDCDYEVRDAYVYTQNHQNGIKKRDLRSPSSGCGCHVFECR